MAHVFIRENPLPSKSTFSSAIRIERKYVKKSFIYIIFNFSNIHEQPEVYVLLKNDNIHGSKGFCKLLHSEWIRNGVLLYNTGNYV